MLVHGPSSIWTTASSIPIETFALVLTGGKSNRWEKGGLGGVGRGAGVGRGLGAGVGPGPAGLYMMVSTGGLVLSRVSNRFAVPISDSSPNTSQPKLVA